MSVNQTVESFHFTIAKEPLGRYILLTVFILEQILGNALLLGLLWYERNGQDIRQTLYNQVFQMAFGCVLLTNVTTQVVGFVIVFHNPGFPEWFCWIKDLVVKFTLIYGSLLAVQLSILKYCYVVLWKRVIAMDDDFIAMYLLTLNVTLSFLGALLDHFWNGPHLADMCFCMDVPWSAYYPYRFKDQTSGAVIFVGACLFVDLGILIRTNIDNLISRSKTNTMVPFEEALVEMSSFESCFGKVPSHLYCCGLRILKLSKLKVLSKMKISAGQKVKV